MMFIFFKPEMKRFAPNFVKQNKQTPLHEINKLVKTEP